MSKRVKTTRKAVLMTGAKRSLRPLAALSGVAAALAVGTTPAYAYHATDKHATDKLDVNGKVFANVVSQSGAATSAADDAASGFHFDRAYFELRYKPDADDMIRITLDQKSPDAKSNTSSSTTGVFVKYAYWQHKFNDAVTLKAGQNHTPLVDYLQTEMWRHRYVQKTYTDYWGAQTSSDLGVSLLGKFGGNFEYYASLMNGEGYTNPTNGAGYALQARVEYHTNGLHVGLYGQSETKHNGVDNYDPSRAVVYAWWENDTIEVGGQYMTADDGSAPGASFDKGKGYNVLANFKLPMGKKTTAFVRYDTIDPMDTGTDQTLTIAGVEFEAAPGVMLAPNFQSADNGTDTINTVGIHGQYKF